VAGKGSASPSHHLLDIYETHLWLATNRREWATLRRRLPGFDIPMPDSEGSTSTGEMVDPVDGRLYTHIAFHIDLSLHEGGKSLPGLVNTCAHEAAHGAAGVMKAVAHAPAETWVDEPSAYLIGWLTQWLWERCMERLATTHHV
jgi:hypothetical protein